MEQVAGNMLPANSGQRSSFESFCKAHGLDLLSAIAIGLHGDGVPFAKQQSVEVLSWNFIALPGMERILFATVEKSWNCRCGCGGRCTLDALLAIFCWSLQCLLSGLFPTGRHDKQPWSAQDKKAGRQNFAGQHFGFSCGLQQVRGDWA